MSDLTPETAIAMVSAGAHNEPDNWFRYPSQVTGPAYEHARRMIGGLLILGFEVRVRSTGCRICGDIEEHLGSNLCGRGHSKEWLKEKDNE